MIVNMDESWEATEKKAIIAFVTHLTTQIGLMSLSLDGNPRVVSPTYILPTPLKTEKPYEQFHLEELTYFVNKSGFMTGDTFASKSKRVLAPWLARIHLNTIQSLAKDDS